MAQLDNPKSITMLFTGAFLISLGVIAFLNMEIQSRSSHGTKIRNENMFASLGRKISQMFLKLRERNAHRRSILYHFLMRDNTTRTPFRKLQYYVEEPNEKQQEISENNRNKTFHRFRHEKKIRRLTERRLQHKTNISSRELTIWNDVNAKPFSNNVSVFLSSLNNQTVRSVADDAKNEKKSKNTNSTNGETVNVIKEKLEPHQNCYSTNDVLEIIAITCLVNFIFWFTIITCVNMFTRNQKIWKSDSCESLSSIGSGLEYELNQNDLKKSNESSPKHSLNHPSVLHDYVSLLKMEPKGDGFEQDCKIFIRDKPKVIRENLCQERVNGNKWRRRRFIHLHNIFFDSTCLDEIKPMIKKKGCHSKNRKQKMINSASMEDLIL